MRWLGRQLYRSGYVRSAVEARACASEVGRRRDRRLTLGLALVVLGLLLGFPVVSLLGVLAATLREPLLVTAVAPATYALSWIVLGVGTLVGGPEVLRQVRTFHQWLTGSLVAWLLRDDDGAIGPPSLPPPAADPECAPEG